MRKHTNRQPDKAVPRAINRAPKRTVSDATQRVVARNSVLLDRLESRQLFAVGLDANGWTTVTPASDTRIIYVSNSQGSDANNGLSQDAPVKSLKQAQSLVRSGMADWVLLKRGDTFESFGEWRASGRSAEEPLLISAYGSGARPQINSGNKFGFITYGKGARSIDNLIISSLSFTPNTYNHYNGDMNLGGIRLLCQGKNITIEDCKVSGYKENIDIAAGDAGLRNVTIRRNVIADAHSSESIGHAHGVWVGGSSNGVIIEENIIDHNGWRAGTNSDRVFFDHDIYIFTGAKNVTIKHNVITRASFYGIKMNGSGVIEDNFFARNAESVYLEDVTSVKDNVITEPSTMWQQNWGVGINTQKSRNATISGNLITTNNNDNASGVAGIQLFDNGTPFSGTVEDNIVYNWRNGIRIATKGNGNGSVIIRNNQSQLTNASSAALDQTSRKTQSAFVYSGNTWFSNNSTGPVRVAGSYKSLNDWKNSTGANGDSFAKVNYPDPDRAIAGYAASRGLDASFEGFINAARSMDKSNWNTAFTASAVNDWFRKGFGVGSSTPDPDPNPDPQPNPDPDPEPQPVISITGADFSNLRSPQSINVTYSDDIGTKPKVSELLVVNYTNGKTYVAKRVAYDPTTHIARFIFKGILPDGSYGASVGSEYSFNFEALKGDADGDGKVNSSDFNLLAGNFGSGSGTFEQGDFDYDGAISSNDFNIFLSQYGKKIDAANRPPPLAMNITASPFASAKLSGAKDLLDALA